MPLRRLPIVLLVACTLVSAQPAPTARAAPPSVDAPPSANALWDWPLAPAHTVTRPFEPPPGPYAAGHRGVDLAGDTGQQVLAAGAGTVAFAGMVAGRPVVSVDHPNGLRTTYEPVRPGLAAGQPVSRGQPLGVLDGGHAGCPVDACLHWGLRRAEIYLDPLSLLRPPRVRLLPWP
ncbi:M23 family metallopeptidase [uncultured Modestobacter sp.]|uniref:M23 family metallopeptidase n=1 Tax=uncultured Modestobacter sp. TaxID=380048 RepID=UPI0026124265|nr:M23 family metallopeptidase [uncultured Modestobacter sp.]